METNIQPSSVEQTDEVTPGLKRFTQNHITLNHDEQVKVFMFRRQILEELSLASSQGLPFRALSQRVGYLAFGSAMMSTDDFINRHLDYLIMQGMVQRTADTLCPDFHRYTLKEAGEDYLHCGTVTESTQPPAETEEAIAPVPASAPHQQRSAILTAIAKALRALWTFFLWLFTEIF